MSEPENRPVTSDSRLSRTYRSILDDLDNGKSASELSKRLSEAESLVLTPEEKSGLLKAIRQSISLAQRNEQYQLNERSLRAVSESAETLTELKNPKAVLESIVVRGRKLLGSDIAWLAGQTEDNRGKILAIDGAYTEVIKSLSGPVDDGIAGRVRKTKSAFSTQDYLSEARFNHNPLMDHAMREEGIRSVLSVPILSDSEVIGVLIVADRYRRLYQPWEVSVLGTLAAHASVAIRNARIFEQKQEALKYAEQANRKLEDKVTVLEHATEAHEKLTTQIAKGGSQQEMIQLISRLLEGALALLDPVGSVVSAYPVETLSYFESSTLESGLRERIVEAIDSSRLSGRSVSLKNNRDILSLMAVSSGSDHLGSLLIRTETPLSDHQIRIFEWSSTAIAVLNLLEEKKTLSDLLDIKATLTDLLSPKELAAQPTRTQILQAGIDTNAPMILAVIDLEPSKLNFFLKKINKRLKALSGIATEMDDKLVVLFNEDNALTARQFLHEHAAGEVNWTGLIALSQKITQATDLPRQYRLATQSLQIAKHLGRRNGIFFYHEYALYAPLLNNSTSADIDAFISATIGELIENDRTRKTELTKTLLTFMHQQQNARATARKLKLHVNTIHNRLEAINAILGPWQLDSRSLEIQLALQLFHLSKVASGR